MYNTVRSLQTLLKLRRTVERCVTYTFDLYVGTEAHHLVRDLITESADNRQRKYERRNADSHTADCDVRDKTDEASALRVPLGSAQVPARNYVLDACHVRPFTTAGCI